MCAWAEKNTMFFFGNARPGSNARAHLKQEKKNSGLILKKNKLIIARAKSRTFPGSFMFLQDFSKDSKTVLAKFHQNRLRIDEKHAIQVTQQTRGIDPMLE